MARPHKRILIVCSDSVMAGNMAFVSETRGPYVVVTTPDGELDGAIIVRNDSLDHSLQICATLTRAGVRTLLLDATINLVESDNTAATIRQMMCPASEWIELLRVLVARKRGGPKKSRQTQWMKVDA